MGMPAAEPPVSTIEELLDLPDDGLRHELLDGLHVLTPSPIPRHQLAVRYLGRELESLLGDRQDLVLIGTAADLRLGPSTLVQPDLFVFQRKPEQAIRTWVDVGVPVLVIEIPSPSTAARDRGSKREIYQRAGVAAYWIVDVDARLVEQWSPNDERPEILRESLEWKVEEEVLGAIDLPALFDRIQR